MDKLEQELLERLRDLYRDFKQTEPGTPEHESLAEAIRRTRSAYEERRDIVRCRLPTPKDRASHFG